MGRACLLVLLVVLLVVSVVVSVVVVVVHEVYRCYLIFGLQCACSREAERASCVGDATVMMMGLTAQF